MEYIRVTKENIENYEEWLKAQYGNYFSEHFPIPYTRKYWTLEAKDLSTTWVGNRMYQPNIKEVLKDAETRFPPGMELSMVQDNTTYIVESLTKVAHTFFEALLLVLFVVYIFLLCFSFHFIFLYILFFFSFTCIR